ncbi:sce7725 family protein [Aeromicrobium fastidiosum]|uniref:sce7725 family protein n=1 Tax=Aeromicrobium fastidiosum TaxID=52699 RepID=UPI00100E61E5|nr:sce7725 family protein [Aeromicrobium fastidiosum]MBP2390045.1 hypothetical protein [Aeromicrobium fastidiosum]
MYFPYLRGKQFELLALKEAAPQLGTSGKITPVIEPVKVPEGGLERSLQALWSNGVNPILVVNPAVGDLTGPLVSTEIASLVAAEPHRWHLGLIISEDTDVAALLAAFEAQFDGKNLLSLIHDGTPADLDLLRDRTHALGRQLDLISDELRDRHYRTFRAQNGSVIMHDGFVPQLRNADYLERPESTFTEDVLYYGDDDHIGFGDYLTIGKAWTSGGFTPRAVAIHWTYQPDPASPIRIRHFTSETNGDMANVGGKFLEAAGKLVAFLDAEDIHTNAAEIMRGHLAADTYPGLGIVKKLSILNHLELVAEILERP